MKTILTLSFLFASSLLYAQPASALPRTEFSVSLSESSLILKPGETRQVTVSITRSKSFKKQKAALGILSTLPPWITVTYDPAQGDFESSIATIFVRPEAESGVHQLVLSADLVGKRKGSILKLTITKDQPVAQ